MTAAVIEIRGLEISAAERKVNRESVHRVPKHRGLAREMVVVEGAAAGGAMKVITLNVIEVTTAIIEGRDRVGTENRAHRRRLPGKA